MIIAEIDDGYLADLEKRGVRTLLVISLVKNGHVSGVDIEIGQEQWAMNPKEICDRYAEQAIAVLMNGLRDA